MPQLFVLPRQVALDDDANPYAGALLYFFQTGTETAQAVYSDSALTVPHSQPVTADAAGKFQKIYLNPNASANYRMRLTTASGSLIDQQDDIDRFTLSSVEIGAALYPLTDAETEAGVTPTDYTYPEGNGLRYGMLGDDSTNNDIAIANLRAVAAEGVACFIPAGVYRYSTSPNWAITGLHLRGERGTVLSHTGTGRAFNAAVASEGSGAHGLNIDSLIVRGNANTTDAIYMAGVVRSSLRFLEVRGGCTGKAFHIKHGVSNHYDTCIISGNIEALTTAPTHGFYLDNNDAGAETGHYTADCTFTNCIAEGFAGKGCALADASGNLFQGGTLEGVNIGLDIDTDSCRRNEFDSIWFEANTTADIRIKGVNNKFTNCYAGSASSDPTVSISTGTGTVFDGGFIREVDLEATSSDTLFLGVSFSDNIALGITGSGTYKAVGCTESDTSLDITTALNDVLGPNGSFTATLTGCTTSPTGSVSYVVDGRHVTLTIPVITGTSNTTAATLTGVPAAIRPDVAQSVVAPAVDNGTIAFSQLQINDDGTITLLYQAASTFTSSGTKGVRACTVTYPLA